MCREAARLGYHGFDLVGPPDWPTLKKHGLVCTMAPAMGVTIRDGLIRPELHDAIEKSMHEEIDLCAANGWPNFITVGGERRGIGDEEGKAHCAALLNRVKSARRRQGRDDLHRGREQQVHRPRASAAPTPIFDHLAWGADVCRRVELTARRRSSSISTTCRSWKATSAPTSSEYFPADRAFPHRRRAWPPRDRRDAGAELSLRRADDCRPRLHRLRGARVASEPRHGIRWTALRRVREIMDV